ncbi:hypothetical protein AVEN_195801-1 [Araneus ventricosus]|uniref:Uncharacterized protein n=1 Tax=Araneus ventricosus TaxID=182803 RepID=A0A4Y2GG25_ARAVE|nr:hypothetical protein AVEN_195801-1 [Araneus ventricosus]
MTSETLNARERTSLIFASIYEAGVLDYRPGLLPPSFAPAPLWFGRPPARMYLRGARTPKKSSPVIKVEIVWKCLQDSSGDSLPAIRIRIKFLGQINERRKEAFGEQWERRKG